MGSKVDFINNCVKTYRALAQHPVLLSAEFLEDACNLDLIKILSRWSQRNIEKGEITKFQRQHLVQAPSGSIVDSTPVDISNEGLAKYSRSGKLYCVVREVKQENKKKMFLEIWNQNGLFKNFDVNAFDIHGDVYCDGEFGSLEWSPNDDKIMFIAEKKAKKSDPFYKQKSGNGDNINGTGEDPTVGDEYIYKPDWGEQLVDKQQSVIGICDIGSETLQVLDGIPSNFCPAQVLWSSDAQNIFGVAFDTEPRRLGLIYCTNRMGYIFSLNFNGEFKILSDRNQSVRSPRLSPDGKTLFWLQRPVGGAHGGCHELVKYDLKTNEKEVLINIVKKGDKTFSGLYMHDLPLRCFSKDSSKLFFSTLNRTKITCYSLDLVTKKLEPIKTGEGSSTVLDVHEDKILISSGTFQNPPTLRMSKSVNNIEWIPITKCEEVNKGAVVKELDFESPNADHSFTYYNALYYGPSPSDSPKESVPLIVYPHGGPHSAAFNDFSLEFNFFLSLGYGILAVNYRGSTGVGQDGVDFLRGKMADTDVKDMQQAVTTVLQNIPHLDSKNIFLYGKSYGGFLVGQLSGQHPDFYRAVVNVNGVTDVYAMYAMSDIPDWCTAESGLHFDEGKPLTMAEATKMIEASPITLVEKIKAPTLFLVGKKDLRVPFYQGIKMYNALKARGVKVRLNLYDGNHTLGTVPAHMDCVINSALWFLENKN